MPYFNTQKDKVQILLSTYNGEKWLDDLFTSLFEQSYQNWQLIVRDDGSCDKTIDIVKQWQQQYPNKIKLINDGKHLGSKLSFNQLVEQATAPYLMFCDQDDVWHKTKIYLQMDVMKEKERIHKKSTPILVHSDMEIVNQQLKKQHSSFWKLRGFRLQQAKQDYLVQNVVSGNSCLFNRAAADLAFPIDHQAMEHDRWLALCIAWFGVVQAVHLPLLKYRQHTDNQIGAFVHKTNIKKSVKAWSTQAAYFLQRYHQQMPPHEQKTLLALANLYKTNWLKRRIILIKENIRKNGLLPNLALLLMA